MNYRREGKRITLEMDASDFSSLMIMLGMAAAAAMGRGFLDQALDFINRLNAGNRDFAPYEIPGKGAPR
jgi:hypothetical protein